MGRALQARCFGVGWFVLAAVIASSPVLGHGLSSSLLELRETPTGPVEVVWTTPRFGLPGTALKPQLPTSCSPLSERTMELDDADVTERWEVECPGGLVGGMLSVEGLQDTRGDVLFRVELADGSRARGVLTPRSPSFEIPERESRGGVFADYLVLGVEHILLGFDHLLFVLGLLLLVQGRRLLIWTVTAFTVGHSVTLSLVALGALSLPSAPVEAAIALSILALAVELARPAGGRASMLRRRPWGMTFVFGLLHGMGFAGALAEVGLPEQEIPWALFAFNVGIELGQVAFLLAVAGAIYLAKRGPLTWPSWTARVPVYCIGTMAAAWTLERLAALL